MLPNAVSEDLRWIRSMLPNGVSDDLRWIRSMLPNGVSEDLRWIRSMLPNGVSDDLRWIRSMAAVHIVIKAISVLGPTSRLYIWFSVLRCTCTETMLYTVQFIFTNENCFKV